LGAAFPLILTFSLGEKEQPMDHFLEFVRHGAEGSFRLAAELSSDEFYIAVFLDV
jgi:hypothetical protein